MTNISEKSVFEVSQMPVFTNAAQISEYWV